MENGITVPSQTAEKYSVEPTIARTAVNEGGLP